MNMYLTARARLMMEQLIMTPQPIHLADLAAEFDVSERTIRRDLKEVTTTLSTFNLKLLREKQYVLIQGSEDDKQRFKWQLLDLTYNEYSPEERQHYILSELLKSQDTIKLISLANELMVTVSTISNDLSKIEEDYQKADLIKRQKGMGISLNATEVEKRRMLSQLFWRKYPKQQFMQVMLNQATAELEEERLSYLEEYVQIERVEQHLRAVRADLPFAIADDSYINLVIHIAISVERIMSGNSIKTKLSDPKTADYPEYELAQQLLSEVLSRPVTEIPPGESEFVTRHIRGAKTQRYVGEFGSNEQLQAISMASQLISKVEVALGHTISSDALLKSLAAHLRPALRRLDAQMGINNPLLQSIKRDYEDLFAIVRASFNELYQSGAVPDEEIGYLVLHFGAALLQEEEQLSLSALVVCASGIGSSRMLVTRLRQAIPQLKELKTISLFELNRELATGRYDLIVSTIDLGSVAYDYFHVSPILSNREISQIDVYLESKRSRYRRQRSNQEKEQQLTKLEAMRMLERRQRYTQTILALLENFKVSKVYNTIDTVEDTLRAICTTLLAGNPYLDVEALIQTLIAREKWSGFGITDTDLALFHARSPEIKAPIFQLFPLSKAIEMPAMDGELIPVTTIVLLLAPEKLSQEGLEIMSQLSSLLIESDETTTLLQSGNEAAINQFIVTKLTDFANER